MIDQVISSRLAGIDAFDSVAIQLCARRVISSRLAGLDAFDSVISSRLAGLDAFDSVAIQLCARRVAAVSGDVRKALHICRHACDLARLDNADKVTLKHIEMAVKQLFANPYVAAMQTLSPTAPRELEPFLEKSMAVKQLFANPYVAAMQTLSPTAQLLVLAALQAVEDSGEADVKIDEPTVWSNGEGKSPSDAA
ncbi:hypothetical protein T484DRAFT_1823350 [Baffinella frigidus]|nr:hypothetical protein T484DRAFT_1823350 [Cryptophyta sp. CCMP2293]